MKTKIFIGTLIFCLVVVGIISVSHTKKEIPLPEIPQEQREFFDTSLSTQYIHAQDTWPPVVVHTDEVFSCVESGEEVLQNGKTTQKTIGIKNYCITVASEGAAGSIYTTYTYATSYKNTTLKTTFTLRLVQCENYDDPNKTACIQERGSFDADILGIHLLENYLLLHK